MNINHYIDTTPTLNRVIGTHPSHSSLGYATRLIRPITDAVALQRKIFDSPRVYKETVVVDDGVVLVGVLTGELEPQPHRGTAG
jgi:hypothetical protein